MCLEFSKWWQFQSSISLYHKIYSPHNYGVWIIACALVQHSKYGIGAT